VFVNLVTIAVVRHGYGGLSSASPYSLIGAAREIMMHIMVEPVLVICLIVAAVKAQSLMFGKWLKEPPRAECLSRW